MDFLFDGLREDGAILGSLQLVAEGEGVLGLLDVQRAFGLDLIGQGFVLVLEVRHVEPAGAQEHSSNQTADGPSCDLTAQQGE